MDKMRSDTGNSPWQLDIRWTGYLGKKPDIRSIPNARRTEMHSSFNIIDLEQQIVEIPSIDFHIDFEINSYKKTCLINGYDDIDYLINNKNKIEEFERKFMSVIVITSL